MFDSNRLNKSDDEDSDTYSEAQSYARQSSNRSGYASSVNSGISHTFGTQNTDEEIKRKVVIFNLEEPLGDEEDRKNSDKNTVKQILITIGAASSVIQNMARHGEPQSTPRRIVVEFATESQQQNVLTNAKNLKNYPKWRGVSIKQFLAPHQRKGYKSTKPNDTDPEKEKMKEELEQMKVSFWVFLTYFVNFRNKWMYC
jgi:hypothetical protein